MINIRKIIANKLTIHQIWNEVNALIGNRTAVNTDNKTYHNNRPDMENEKQFNFKSNGLIYNKCKNNIWQTWTNDYYWKSRFLTLNRQKKNVAGLNMCVSTLPLGEWCHCTIWEHISCNLLIENNGTRHKTTNWKSMYKKYRHKTYSTGV